MNKLASIHNEAMDLALHAKTSQENGDNEKALTLFMSAYKKEKEAALFAESIHNPEPGLSILFRSAAWLAINAGEYKDAEQLTVYAMNSLKDSPIRNEFREILIYIYGLDMQNSEKEEYRLHIPKAESSLFKSLMAKMGWSFSSMSSLKRIAVF